MSANFVELRQTSSSFATLRRTSLNFIELRRTISHRSTNYRINNLPHLVRWEDIDWFWLKDKLLVWLALRVVIEAFDLAALSGKTKVVEATDCKAGVSIWLR